MWTFWKSQGARLAADCNWPVEAKFLVHCVGEDPKAREWEGPYPFFDIGSILFAKGMDPLAKYPRIDGEECEHNPLHDARQSARLLLEALKKV